MNTINVSSLPIHEVIQDMAKCLDIPFFVDCGQYHIELPNHIGKGTIIGVSFHDGLGFISYDCTFNDDLEIQFIVNYVHPLKFLYCLEGNVDHSFEHTSEKHIINTYQSSIVASDNNNGHVLYFKKGVHTVIHSLEVNREVFKPKIDCEMKSLNPELQELFLDVNAGNSFYYEGYYSLEFAVLFREMEHYREMDFARRLFFEAKAYEILTKQISQFEDDLQNEGSRSLLRKNEILVIEKAAIIIQSNVADIGTIEDLAREVGLNVNKLQSGFQALYNCTVHDFIQKTRLENAMSLLRNTSYSLGEISDRIGITSKSYFSKLFKDHYNITPSEFRKKNFYKKI